MKKSPAYIDMALTAVFATAMVSTPVLAKSVAKTSKAKAKASSSKAKKATAKTAAPQFIEQSAETQQLAQWIVAGQYTCFDHQTVLITPRTDFAGYIDLQTKGKTYHLLPVASNTGALRLESKADNLFWLQLSVKSILFNSRTGIRIVDDCQPNNPPPAPISAPALSAQSTPVIATPMPLMIEVPAEAVSTQTSTQTQMQTQMQMQMQTNPIK
jgi:hypothetical protein